MMLLYCFHSLLLLQATLKNNQSRRLVVHELLLFAAMPTQVHLGGCQNPFWVLNIIRHLIFRVPRKGPQF